MNWHPNSARRTDGKWRPEVNRAESSDRLFIGRSGRSVIQKRLSQTGRFCLQGLPAIVKKKLKAVPAAAGTATIAMVQSL